MKESLFAKGKVIHIHLIFIVGVICTMNLGSCLVWTIACDVRRNDNGLINRGLHSRDSILLWKRLGTAKVGINVGDNDFETRMVKVVKKYCRNFQNAERTIRKYMLSFIFFYGLSKFVYVVMVTETRDVLGGGRFHRKLCVALSKEEKEELESVGGCVKEILCDGEIIGYNFVLPKFLIETVSNGRYSRDVRKGWWNSSFRNIGDVLYFITWML